MEGRGKSSIGSAVARVREGYGRARDYFTREIWAQRLDQLPAKQARRYRTARIVHATVQSIFLTDTLHVRAAALTYFTVLSIVPLLAFAFALLKGFGAYDALIEGSVRPYVTNALAGNGALRTAFEKVLEFVEQTNVASLGFVGLLTLLYAATRLLRNVEEALNEVWGVGSGRELVQQLRDYLAIIIVTPLCLMAGAALGTAGQALDLWQSAASRLGIGQLLDAVVAVLGPLLVLFVGLLFLYKVMPYTKVRVLSAMLGASIGACLWYGVLVAHVRFQVGVARYNALYSSFGAIPIFLAWLQLSWLVVLVGARIGAAHQNQRSVAQQRRSADFDQASQEMVCMAAAVRIASAFCQGEGPISARTLSDELDVPMPLLRSLLDKLESAALLVRAAGSEPAYTLARPAESIHIKDVVDAHRLSRDSALHQEGLGESLLRARELWFNLDAAAALAPANLSLRELVANRRAGNGEHGFEHTGPRRVLGAGPARDG